jgi:hypothetical protein
MAEPLRQPALALAVVALVPLGRLVIQAVLDGAVTEETALHPQSQVLR